MMEDMASSKMAHRKDMLLMAQQRLDEINRGNMGLVGSRRLGSATSKQQHKHQHQQHQQLLSTLLYVALMSYKLEDMKVMLEEEDPIAYLEWRSLLENLHSPEFHNQERILQNQRVSTVYERKRHYKAESTRLEAELIDTKQRLIELQRTMNETSYSTSKTINAMQEERAVIVATVEEGRRVINEMKVEMECLRVESAKNDVKLQSFKVELDKKNSLLVENKTVIGELEGKMSQYRQEAALATKDANLVRSAFEEVKFKLNATESVCDEKNATIGMLQHDNAAMNAKLVAMTESLDATTKKLNTCESACDEKNLTIGMLQRDNAVMNAKLVATTESLDATTKKLNASESACNEKNLTIGMLQRDNAVMDAKLVAMIESLDDATKKLNASESACNEKNLTIGIMQRDTAAMNAKLVAMTESLDDAKKNLDVSRNFIAATASSFEGLKFQSNHISDLLNDLVESNTKDTTQAELSKIQQSLNDIARLRQEDGLRQHIDVVQQRLDVIHEFQRKHTAVQTELIDVEYRLRDVIVTQSNSIADVMTNKLDFNIKEVGCMFDRSRDDMKSVLSHGIEISDVLTDVSNKAASLESRMCQVHEVVSTLSTSTTLDLYTNEIQSRLLSVKGMVGDLHRNQSALQAELLDVENRLKDLLVTQSNNITTVIDSLDGNILKQTGCLIEESREDLKEVLAHGKEVSDALSVLSNTVAGSSASLDGQLSQVQEVLSTLSSSKALESFSRTVCIELLSMKRGLEHLSQQQQQQLKDDRRNKMSKEEHESIKANELASSYIAEALAKLAPPKQHNPPRLIIAGAPASGKGTQCELIKQHFGVVHLSTGDMLRAAVSAGTDIGKTAKEYMDSGKLVPDEVIINVVKERLAAPDCLECGWLLDGFPRTLAQTKALEDAGVHADCFIFLNVQTQSL
jgi:chromosome segregation ATPase